MKSPTHILTSTLVSKPGATIRVERIDVEHPIADSHSPHLAFDQTDKQSRLSAIWNYKIMRVGTFAKILTTLILLATVALVAVSLAGCATPNNNGAVRAANGEIRATDVQIRSDAAAIQDDANKLWSMVSEKAKPILEDILKHSLSITDASKRNDVATAKSDAASDAQAIDSAKKDRKIAKYQDSIWMKLGHFVEWVAGIAGAIAAIWLIIRACTDGSVITDVFRATGFAGRLLGKLPVIGRFFGGGAAANPNLFQAP